MLKDLKESLQPRGEALKQAAVDTWIGKDPCDVDRRDVQFFMVPEYGYELKIMCGTIAVAETSVKCRYTPPEKRTTRDEAIIQMRAQSLKLLTENPDAEIHETLYTYYRRYSTTYGILSAIGCAAIVSNPEAVEVSAEMTIRKDGE